MPYHRSLARSAFVRQLRACCDCGKRSTKEAALDIGLILKSAVMGVVEGLTEFLPVSSTGHLILAGALLNFDGQNVKVFEIAIQAGAIFAVMWQYRERLLRTVAGITRDRTSRRFAFNLLIAFLPAACVGLLLGSFIKATLFQPLPVAAAFIVGGFIILWVERRQRRIIGGAGSCRYRVQSIDEITWADALKIGLAQCLALIPGTSRSGATIIGAMIFGLSRPAATEFSFHLGIPTLLAAAGYSLWQARESLSAADLPSFGTGLAFAFVAALVCIRWLIRYVSVHDFTAFAWYRIAFGGLVIATAATGWISWQA